MADLIVVTGPPGAGKSTVAELLVGRFSPSALVAGDHFFGFLRRGAVPPWEPAAHAQNELVTRAAAAATGRLVTGGLAVVYDGVLGPWFLPVFLAATGLERLHYAVLLPTEEQCVERVRSRRGHGFTDLDAARRMHREFATADVDPRHVLGGHGSPAVTAEAVTRRFTAGDLVVPRP